MLDKAVDMVRFWWKRPHWFAELWSSLSLMGFGAWSAVDPKALASFPTFHEATRLMPDVAWECVAGSVGAMQFLALWADRRWLRGLAAALASSILSALAFGAVIYFPSPIDVFPLGFLGINLFAQLRAVGNVP